MTNSKNIPFLMLSSMMLLSACSASNEKQGGSSASDSESSPYTMSVSDAYYEILNAQAEEISSASSTFYRDESSSSRLSNVMEETYTTYEDGSTTSSGTYTKKEENKENQIDTFKRIATEMLETYETSSGSNATYSMFTKVLDFDKGNVGSNPTYQDSASKVYIIESADDAGSLAEGEYILSSDFGLECSANLTGKLSEFLANNVIDNVYAQQLGVASITPSLASNGDWDYSLAFSYSYDEDDETVGSEINVAYSLSGDKKRLLSYSASCKTTYSREGEDDSAVSLTASSGTITYGKRASMIDGDALNPEDYFLTEVKSVGLSAQNGFNWETIIPDMANDGYSVPYYCSKVTGFAYKAKPEKVINTSLTPYATSNPEVVALEDGEFVIKGVGKCSLTFAYYKKDSSTGVFKYTKVIANNVSVKTAAPSSISFGNAGILNSELSLIQGKTYSWEYSITPSKASSDIVVTSSDPNVLAASLDDDKKLKLEAKSGGAATITLTSALDSAISVSKTFCVIESMDYADFLTTHTFYNKNAWGVEHTIEFSADGKGTRRIVQGSSDVIEDTFNWSNEDNALSFSFDKTPKIRPYEEGLIIGVVDKQGAFQGYGLSITCGESDYSTGIYTIVE